MAGNLSKRLIVAAIGIPALISIIYFGGYALYIFCLLVALLASWELSAMVLQKNIEVGKKLISIMTVISVSIIQFAGFSEMAILLIFVSFFVTGYLVILQSGVSGFATRFSITLLAVYYPSLLISFSILLRKNFDSAGWLILLFVFVNTWLADTFAYAFGKWFGKRKFAPKISPNKTWAGFVFSFFGGFLAAIALYLLIPDFRAIETIFIASFLATLFGQIGDLIESAIKRDCGVKDSSNLIPGHGGVLDRFDSLLFALPAVYFTILLLK